MATCSAYKLVDRPRNKRWEGTCFADLSMHVFYVRMKSVYVWQIMADAGLKASLYHHTGPYRLREDIVSASRFDSLRSTK